MAGLTARSRRSRAGFLPAAGWTVNGSTFPWGDEDAQVVWAANVRVADGDAATGYPIETVRQLPSDGIVVCVSMAPQVEDGPSLYPEGYIPLRLRDGTFLTGQYEDQAAPNVSLYRIAAHVKDQYVTAEVFFGVPDPSSASLQAGDAQLSRFVLKANPNGKE
jgi:hypothetical protein